MDEKGVELESKKIMLWVPNDSIEITVTCKVYQNGEVQTVEQRLSVSDIRERMKDAEENYLDPDDRYVTTEEGRRYIENLANKEQ